MPRRVIHIYHCYSDLHAIQACVLSKENPGLCFYSSSVSEDYLATGFMGQTRKIPPSIGFRLLPFLMQVCRLKKRNRDIVLYTGNKSEMFSGVYANKFNLLKVVLLDDGLASYGLQPGALLGNGGIRQSVKRLLSRFLDQFGILYFHELRVRDLERPGIRYFMFPELVTGVAGGCENRRIEATDSVVGGEPPPVAALMGDEVYIASYDESLEYLHSTPPIGVLLHPRVQPRVQNWPIELALMKTKKLHCGMSSVWLVMIWLGYRGELVITVPKSQYGAIEKAIRTIAPTTQVSLRCV